VKVLVLGGTAWLGHTIAATALMAGHEVTCVARGSAVPAGTQLVRADRDDTDALVPVSKSHWDAVIDVSRQPGQVRRAVRDLRSTAKRFVFVSTVSVYASHSQIGADEDAAVLDPLGADAMQSPSDYGPAKVACETAVLDAFGAENSAIVRAGLIGGPGDPTGRTGYWPLRCARPSTTDGSVLVPDAPDLSAALIDVRDLATWIVRLAEGRASGTFNAVGEAMPFVDHLSVAQDVAGHTGPLVAAAEEWLIEKGVAEWVGPRSLPLWLVDRASYGMNTRSSDRAVAAGLERRPLRESLADALALDRERYADVANGAGLNDDEERALIAQLRATP
jgi:2'-hydroxyisoflavone reductase